MMGLATIDPYSQKEHTKICIFLWTALDALFFPCWEFTRAYVLFWLHLISGSIYSTRNRIFIIQLSLLQYFLAVDFATNMSDSGHPSDGATESGPPIHRSSQFDAVFEQFKGYVDSRLHELSTTSASNTESNKSLSETKKLRREAEASKLKKKGNLKQFLFNAELLHEVKSITEDLQTQDTASANKTAKRTIRLFERRQKLIKLADKSEAGWLSSRRI